MWTVVAILSVLGIVYFVIALANPAWSLAGFTVSTHHPAWSLVGFTVSMVVFLLSLAFSLSSFTAHYSRPPSSSRSATPALSVEQLKERSQYIPYAYLAREPRRYIGTLVVFTGKVVQATQNDSYVLSLRVNVTRDQYGWDDTVWVDYQVSPSAPRILEGDLVDFWGQFVGIKSYTAVLGQTIQIPQVVAKIVEIR